MCLILAVSLIPEQALAEMASEVLVGEQTAVKASPTTEDQPLDQAQPSDESQPAGEEQTLDEFDANGKEVQPTEQQKAKVSFTLAEVADKNLETQVYHVSTKESTGKPAAESLDVSTQATPETGKPTTVVVQTDGFSLYTEQNYAKAFVKKAR